MIGTAAWTGSLPACPLCGGARFASLSAVAGGALIRCERCGLHASGAASSDELLYPADFYAPPRRRTLAGRLFGLLERVFLRRRAAIVARLLPAGPGLRVLDVGCGVGGFLIALREVRPDLDLTGVEPSAVGAVFARQRDLKVLGSLPEPQGLGGRLDCVTLWHVLEHVRDLSGLLGHLHRLVADDGWLVVAVPNITSLGFRLFGDRWGLLDIERHYWHFSSETLAALVTRHGFEPACPPATLLEYEFPITVLSLMNALSGRDRMLFYQAIKNELTVQPRQRLKVLGLIALLPLVAMVAGILDGAAAVSKRPNNLLQVFRRSRGR